MKLRLSISWKMGLGFGVLALACLLNSWFIYKALSKSKKLNNVIITVYEPSVSNLEKLYNQVAESRMQLKNWVYVETENITPDKLKLVEILELQLPFLQKNIQAIYHQWTDAEQLMFNGVISTLNDTLYPQHKQIIGFLNRPEAYKDTKQLEQFKKTLQANGSISLNTDQTLSTLSYLLDKHKNNLYVAQSKMDLWFGQIQRLIIVTSFLLIILAIVITIITIKSLVVPINYIKRILISMGKGILPNERIREGSDELGEIAKALNSLVGGLKDISNFAMEIGKGNFNSDFAPLSNDDILGNSLIKMREELSNAAAEENKRKKEDAQRNWATQGIAKFSEILRQNTNSLNELSYNIVSNLVPYLDANQGGVFIVNDGKGENLRLELSACHAYNRKKFLEKVVTPGESLVGRCYQERATIYLTDIPKNYIKITSGLGEDNPTSLLIVPLTYNDVVFGVIEIASFNEFETYQIEFVEKIATSIASTISSVKINIQTNKLLESSRQQAEEMASQEEEMRQSMEELRATQEESQRKELALRQEVKELKKLLDQ
jgi:methyl-accepting chemotaxis protein